MTKIKVVPKSLPYSSVLPPGLKYLTTWYTILKQNRTLNRTKSPWLKNFPRTVLNGFRNTLLFKANFLLTHDEKKTSNVHLMRLIKHHF